MNVQVREPSSQYFTHGITTEIHSPGRLGEPDRPEEGQKVLVKAVRARSTQCTTNFRLSKKASSDVPGLTKEGGTGGGLAGVYYCANFLACDFPVSVCQLHSGRICVVVQRTQPMSVTDMAISTCSIAQRIWLIALSALVVASALQPW